MLSLMQLDKAQISQLFHMADINHDGHVSLQEFDLLLSSGQTNQLLPPLKAVLAQLEVCKMDLAKPMPGASAEGHLSGIPLSPPVKNGAEKSKKTAVTPAAAATETKKGKFHFYTEAEVIRQIFRVIDLDESGYIDAHETLLVFSGLGFSVAVIKSLFAQADLNFDGLISEKEFAILMVRAQETPEMNLPPLRSVLAQTEAYVKGNISDSEKGRLPSKAYLRPPRTFPPAHVTGFAYTTDNVDQCACRMPGTQMALGCSVM